MEPRLTSLEDPTCLQLSHKPHLSCSDRRVATGHYKTAPVQQQWAGGVEKGVCYKISCFPYILKPRTCPAATGGRCRKRGRRRCRRRRSPPAAAGCRRRRRAQGPSGTPGRWAPPRRPAPAPTAAPTCTASMHCSLAPWSIFYQVETFRLQYTRETGTSTPSGNRAYSRSDLQVSWPAGMLDLLIGRHG